MTIPPCDLLIHAGDLTARGSLRQLSKATRWLQTAPAKQVLVIAGNHDRCFQRSPVESRAMIERFGIYLEDESFEYQGLKIYGSPWQPKFFNWAFNLPRGEPLREKWLEIPLDTDILLTHTPPFGLMDRTRFGSHVGCEALREILQDRTVPLHVFGHIHEGYGVRVKRDRMSVNASTCTVRYDPINPPVVIDWRDGEEPCLVSGGAAGSR